MGSSEADRTDCTCGYLRVDLETVPARNWSDSCPLHGVGTGYFQRLEELPFGYAQERGTTREEWLAFLAAEESARDDPDLEDVEE